MHPPSHRILTLHHITSHHITSPHITSHHITSHHPTRLSFEYIHSLSYAIITHGLLGCVLQHQERYLLPLMRIVKRFLILGSFYRWLKGTRDQRLVRVCMWRKRPPRSDRDTALVTQTVATFDANHSALLDSSYSAPLLKAFHVWLNCAHALRLYKKQAIYAIAHDGIVLQGIRRAMSWHDRATTIQCMIRSHTARKRTKLQRKYCHVVRMVARRKLYKSMEGIKRFTMIAKRATAILQRGEL